MQAQPQILDNFKFETALDLTHTITAGTIASPSNIAQGEIVVTDLSNVVLDTTTILTVPYFKIVQGRGTGIPWIETKPLSVAQLTAYNIRPYQAKVQEVFYVGYNAVTNTGSFDVINNNYYDLEISFQEIWGQEASSLYIPTGGQYYSDATATEEEIVAGVYKNLVAQLSKFPKQVILAERVASAAGQATNDAGVTIPRISRSAVLPNISAAASVGDYVRLGAQSTDTLVVYKITAISGTTVTFDTAVQTDFTGTVYRVLAADIASGDMGIRLTGLNQVFILDSRPVSLVEFQVGLKNGGATPLVEQVGPFIGNGTYELCRQEEAASWRNQGIMYNYTEFPPTSIPTDLDTTGIYSTLGLSWQNIKYGLTNGEFKGTIMIALELTSAGTPNTYSDNITGSTISVADVIDAAATNLGTFSSQLGNL